MINFEPNKSIIIEGIDKRITVKWFRQLTEGLNRNWKFEYDLSNKIIILTFID